MRILSQDSNRPAQAAAGQPARKRRNGAPLPFHAPPPGLLLACALLFASGFANSVLAVPIEIPIDADADDGVEIDRAEWNPDPAQLSLGRPADGSVREVALRFSVPELATVSEVVFARLRFNSLGGQISDRLTLTVEAVPEIAAAPLSQDRRPSTLPRASHRLVWEIGDPWLDGGPNPLFCYSPDFSAGVNEVLALPGWPGASPTLVVCVRDSSASSGNSALFSDFDLARAPVTLEICRTLDEAFSCPPLLGRPTAHSAVVDFTPLVAMDAFVEYGFPGFSRASQPKTIGPGEPCEVELSRLEPGMDCWYRLRYRRAGSGDEFASGAMQTFHTQRAPWQGFTFTTQADPHIWASWSWPYNGARGLALYKRTLENVAADAPDFHFDLGDFSMTAFSPTWDNAVDRYRVERGLLGKDLQGVPFYLVLGNHEGELGWQRMAGDSAAVWSERARRLLVPNPFRSEFYDGCADSAASGGGLRESYYSWEWGDALFVVLDPFWYTTEKPHHNPEPGHGGGWEWTLGLDQYEWLYHVLQRSHRRWKIVLLHHLVGGVEDQFGSYGRGGIEAVKWSVAQRPTFEWGGENEIGVDVYATRRPGWNHGPIHDMLVQSGVDLVIHGHDHFFAVQRVDGITYVECPQPMDAQYTYGCRVSGGYENGFLLPNSGHLRFRVTPEDLVIEYVRSYLDGDGQNGEVAFQWSLVGAAGSAEGPSGSSGEPGTPVPPAAQPRLLIAPNPAPGGAQILFRLTGSAGRDLRVFDAGGRLCAVPSPARDGTIVWDQRNLLGRAVPSGMYYCVPDRAPAAAFVIVR